MIYIILQILAEKRKNAPRDLVLIFGLMVGATFISYVINAYSPLLYIWGFRNNFRFIIFGIVCAMYIEREDIETIYTILYYFFLLNIVVVTYQYFFVSYSQYAIGDYISGLFSNGLERGGNASLDWLMCIVVTYEIVKFLGNKGNIRRLLISLFGSLYMASLAEIKIFFVQIIIIGIAALFIGKKSMKTILFTVLGALSVYIGIGFLYTMFPEFNNFFTLDTVFEYISRKSGYSTGHSEGVNRLTAISYVLENFLTTPIMKIFGIGLGNADFSSFSFLISSFYKNYQWTGYTFFYSAFLLIEGGLLGFALYLINICAYILNAIKIRSSAIEEKIVKQNSVIIGIMCFMMFFSNQTMKLEASAYLIYLILALPFAIKRQKGRIGDDKTKERRIKIKVRWYEL